MITNIYLVSANNGESWPEDRSERYEVVAANTPAEAIEKAKVWIQEPLWNYDADLKFDNVTIPDNNFTKVPTKTGYYWLQHYNPTTGLADCEPEIVRVAFGFNYRRKTVTRVIAKFWQCNLEEVINAYWSEEINPPAFPAPKENA